MEEYCCEEPKLHSLVVGTRKRCSRGFKVEYFTLQLQNLFQDLKKYKADLLLMPFRNTVCETKVCFLYFPNILLTNIF